MSKKKEETKGLAIGSLVTGILAIIFCWVPFLNLILAVVATVGGAKGKDHGVGVAGLVLGIIELSIFGLVFLFVILAAIGAAL